MRFIKTHRISAEIMRQIQFFISGAAQSLFYPRSINPPVYLKTVCGDANIKLIAHFSIKVLVIRVTYRPKLSDIQSGIAALQWIVSPGNPVNTLFSSLTAPMENVALYSPFSEYDSPTPS